MNITVITPPHFVDLTTLAAVKGELRLTTVDEARDAWISSRIEEASRAIEDELGRPITRQRVSERFNGTGRMLATLEVTPLAALEGLENAWLGEIDLSITAMGQEYARIEDRDAGLIWNRLSFPDDSPREVWLTVSSMAQSGVKPWMATYLGGWLTRADDVLASGLDILASGTDIILPEGSDAVMPLVAPGDVIRLTGWALNRGRFVVTGRTDLSISVDGSLQVEVGGNLSVIEVRNVPSKLERACIEAVRTWYYQQTLDPTLTEEHIGDWGASYGTPGGGGEGASSHVLPGSVLSALDQYRRLM